MKRGFTILELLVASLLLAMLVTMLSMMFNQSSIAWRTGVSGVVELDTVREKLGVYHDIQDELLPGIGQQNVKYDTSSDNRKLEYRTVSLWKKNADNKLRVGERAFEAVDWENAPQFTIDEARKGSTKDLGSSTRGSAASAFVVGVRSYGPDGKPDTEDDVTNWPEEVE